MRMRQCQLTEWRSLSPAGGVGELGEVWPSLVVHAVHPIFIDWGEEHRSNRSGAARLTLPVSFNQAHANKVFSAVSHEENFIWATFTLPIGSQKSLQYAKKLAPTHLQETSCWIWSLRKTFTVCRRKTRLLLLLKGLWRQDLIGPTHPKYRQDLL